MFQPLIDYLRERSVLILGFGREGRSTYRLIREFLPEKEISIADKFPVTIEDKNVNLFCGDGYMSVINDFEVVIKSPGISVRDVEIKNNVTVTCQTDLFLKFGGCKCIGITGTKGKTTTSTLTYLILKAAGINTALIGNIGVPVFESLGNAEKMIPVIELSSHQLEFTRTSPHIGVLTNVYPEHLDHYNGFKGYVNAKLNIVRNQKENDIFIYNADQGISEFIDESEIKSKKIGISAEDAEKDPFLKELVSCNPRLLGRHNRFDILLAATAAKALGIEDKFIRAGIESFDGIPHRMENVGTYKGITFYNDSIATIPEAVMCAVEALKKVGSLIIGGNDRGLDYSDFMKDLSGCNVDNIICLPETGHAIGNSLKEMGSDKNIIIAKDMEEAVKAAFEFTESGKICLLSPAASSYNRYKNFEEKGEHYKSLIKKLGEK